MDEPNEIEVNQLTSLPSDSSCLDFLTTVARNRRKQECRVFHGLFKWAIENFSCFPRGKDKYCKSPAFVLEQTSWYIALHPKANHFGVDKIALNFIRSASDNGPKTVRVSYKLGLENFGNKLWFKPEEDKIFGKGDSYGFETSILGHLEDFMAEGLKNKDNTLSVWCEVYVRYGVSVSSSNMAPEVDSELPRDLVKFYASQEELADVLIEIPKYRVKAHKSVLFARSQTLARMLEDDKSVLQFDCTRSCLNCVLFYMYSGSLDLMAKNAIFSIGLYEFARELWLTKLSDVLTPQKSEMRSRVLVDRCKIECTLLDFRLSYFSEKDGQSRYFLDESTNIGVSISFLKLVDSSSDVKCRVELFGLATSLDFNFGLILVDRNPSPFEIFSAKFSKDSGTEFRNSVFTYIGSFRIDDVLRCSSVGKLWMIFACLRYSLKHLPEESKLTDPRRPIYDSEDWLEDLSTDLEMLFESRKLSDITLVSKGIEFPVHRSILAARSEYFRKRIHYTTPKSKVINIRNVQPRILDLMLLYMYKGALGDTDDLTNYDFLELYVAAEEYKVKSLKKECEEFLAIHLDIEFVQDLMTVADKYKNDYLMSLCSDYNYVFGQSSPDSSDVPREDST